MALSMSYTIVNKGAGGGSQTSNPYDFDTGLDLVRFVKNAVIKIAVDALAEEQAQGFEKDPVVVVNNKAGKNVLDFSPLSSPNIRFIARSELKEVLIFAFEAIDSRMFAKTGKYLRSNIVTYNGRQVASDRSGFYSWLENVKAFGPEDRIRFINTAPYARKLERFGVHKDKRGFGPKLKMRNAKRHEKKPAGTKYLVPNGVYALAHRAVDRKYGKNAYVKFDLLTGNKINLTGPGTVYKTGASKGKSYLYPTILIGASTTGLKGLLQ